MVLLLLEERSKTCSNMGHCSVFGTSLVGSLHLQQNPDAAGASLGGWSLLHLVLHCDCLCQAGFLHHQGLYDEEPCGSKSRFLS